MIKFYEAVKINKNDTVNKVIKKINISKRDERYYPVGLYTKKDKIIGILSLGDIRRIAIKKINFSEPAINYLNKRTIVINQNSFDADLINKLNFFKKNRKIEFDFIISKDRKKIKIIKNSSLENLQEFRKTCIIGLGHIGLPLLVYLSNKTSNIIGYDKSIKVINNLKKGKIGFFEKNLKILLKQNFKRKKYFLVQILKKLKLKTMLYV